MSAPASRRAGAGCGMAPLVEARRDGRVGEREAAQVARHLATCAECRALERDLDHLGALGRRPLLATQTPLEHQRGRVRLLREAVFAPDAPARGGIRAGMAGRIARAPRWQLALVAAVILAGGLAAARGIAPSPVMPSTAPSARVDATARPLPSSRHEQSIRAEIAAPSADASASAPVIDAEIDAEEEPAGAPSGSPAHAPRVPGAALGTRSGAPRAPTAASRGSERPAAARGNSLADGVELIERGDYGAAAERLTAFRREHPDDARAEDAAFLAIIALQRAGRLPEAAAAARDYVAAFPNGHRRAEAQAIAAGAQRSP